MLFIAKIQNLQFKSFCLRVASVILLTVGGMKRWGFWSSEPINRYELCQRVMRLLNNLTPNVL